MFLSQLVSRMAPTAGANIIQHQSWFHILIHLLSFCFAYSVTVAIDAMHSASNPHAFMGVTEQGLAAIVKTRGNQDVHVILRGGTGGPNYTHEHVKKAADAIQKKRGFASIMVDCSRECFLQSRSAVFDYY